MTYGVPVTSILCEVEGLGGGSTDDTRDNTSNDGDGDWVDNSLAQLHGLDGGVGDEGAGRGGSGNASKESGDELELHIE